VQKELLAPASTASMTPAYDAPGGRWVFREITTQFADVPYFLQVFHAQNGIDAKPEM
jgi:hypothetical protein